MITAYRQQYIGSATSPNADTSWIEAVLKLEIFKPKHNIDQTYIETIDVTDIDDLTLEMYAEMYSERPIPRELFEYIMEHIERKPSAREIFWKAYEESLSRDIKENEEKLKTVPDEVALNARCYHVRFAGLVEAVKRGFSKDANEKDYDAVIELLVLKIDEENESLEMQNFAKCMLKHVASQELGENLEPYELDAYIQSLMKGVSKGLDLKDLF